MAALDSNSSGNPHRHDSLYSKEDTKLFNFPESNLKQQNPNEVQVSSPSSSF